MANPEQLNTIRQGASVWNAWRRDHPDAEVDLTEARLDEIELENVNLRDARLDRIRLRWAYLRRADLTGASVRDADLRIIDLSRAECAQADFHRSRFEGAYLRQSNFEAVDFSQCSLKGVNFDQANLAGANLSESDATKALFVDVNLEGANLERCRVYGSSVWNLRGTSSTQENLIITRPGEPTVTVDNLEVAQFIYLMLNNQRVRSVIDTITSKVVLILGRFTPARKPLLDALRVELRRHDYLPIIFDFDAPSNRDVDEAVNLLARMACFIVADLTDPKCVLQELRGIVPSLPNVPVQPLLSRAGDFHGMIEHFRHFPWFLEDIRYDEQKPEVENLSQAIVDRARKKLRELRGTPGTDRGGRTNGIGSRA